MRRPLRFSDGFVWFLLFALACGASCATRRVCEPPPVDPTNTYPAVSDNLHADIYLDATLSMKGFIVPGTSTYYQQTIPLLESAVERGWPGGSISFNKFGTKTSMLEGRKYLDAAKPSFYTDQEVNLKTYIEGVIDSASTDNLTIVVTDLFQDNADVNLITGKLKEKYVARDLAVGVFAVRSEFEGAVYDVGPNNYSFTYKSDVADPTSFRPFYILALGKHADIERYFEMLRKSGLDSFPAKNAAIFSRRLSANLASFKDATITSTIKMAQVRSLLPLDVKDDRVVQFRIRGTPPLAGFAATLKYSPLPYTPEPASSELVPVVTAFKCGGGERASNSLERHPESLAENGEAARAFTVKTARLSGSEVKIEVEVTPASLPGDATYCYRFVLQPRDYHLPGWISEWDMDGRKIEEWKRAPNSFNGSTTYNLNHFLSDLWATTLQVHKPKVAEIYCYIQRG